MKGALVLAAHGSRRNPEANALVRRLAHRVRARRLFDEVAVAFHQGEPGFDAVLDELTSREVTVVPLFTSAGYYADRVLPEALARNRRYDEVRLRLSPPVGTHPGIAALVARCVSELLRQERLERRDVTLALVGHGTSRHPESRTATLQLADILARRRVARDVIAAFLDDEPGIESLPNLASQSNLIVVPFLIGGSTHVEKDLPRRLIASDPERRVIVDQAVGTYPELVELVVDLGRRHAPRPVRELRRRHTVFEKIGKVYLVGAGPGDPGLITVRGLDLLRQADLVVHDRLIPSELLDEAPAAAQLIDAGKSPGHQALTQTEINALLVSHARAGRRVIRLKGGDPFVFGRGSEEVDACREAGIQVEVVPGISSAIAGPAAAGIPVTARGVSSSFTVITGHVAEASEKEGTLVLLMARSKLAEVARKLIAEGRDPATPAACVQSATTLEQRVVRATLGTIAEAADREGLEAPVVTLVGKVAALATVNAARAFKPIRVAAEASTRSRTGPAASQTDWRRTSSPFS